MLRRLLSCVVMLAACTLAIACSAFQKPDGSTTVAPDPVKIQAAADTAAAAASAIPVWGQALGAVLAIGGTALAAHYRGKEAGWTEAAGSPAQAVITPPAPPPGSTTVTTSQV